MENFKELYRFMLYSETGILVNDLTDVFKEINIFIEKKIKPYIIEKEYKKLIFNSIELRYEDNEFKWRIHLDDEILEDGCVYFDNEDFKMDVKEFKEIIEECGLSMFPKVLYDKAFLIFTKVVSDYINNEIIQEKLELFDIMTIDNNGANNVIY